MLLRDPYFIDNLSADQPYNSMLVIAPYCFNNCKGCHNQHLKEGELKDFSVDFLVNEYKSNPFWRGITLAGLEPYHCNTLWWCEMLDFIVKAEIENVTIYTSKDTPFIRPPCKNLYYKTGKYIKDKPSKTVNIDGWGITLASDNQDFKKTSS